VKKNPDNKQNTNASALIALNPFAPGCGIKFDATENNNTQSNKQIPAGTTRTHSPVRRRLPTSNSLCATGNTAPGYETPY
jgi:hypothetical protein